MAPTNVELFDEDDAPIINPYEVLGIEKTATANEVKSAYRKAALKNHPDKVPASDKEFATKTFQTIAFAYAVLSSPTRRAHYDRTGSTSEALSSSDDFSWSSFYRAQYEDVVSDVAIEAFAAKYKNSEEEKDDVLAAYEKGEGDMDVVYEMVMLSDVVVDDKRFREIINDAIREEKVEAYNKFTKESKSSKRERTKAAKDEANEAMEYAEELGIKDKLFGGKKSKKDDGQDGLKALIMKRQQDLQEQGDGFLDRLAAKYAEPEKKGKRGGKGRKKTVVEDEPTEEDFQKASARLGGKSRSKADDDDKNTEGRRSKRVKR
ncbi:hypothetical protein VC83_00077 [Pseudogymnoascus destructans]|uniref:J domain-containing protein n=2 Tax=Pseudogymnoascus destructans TaxID=655981 RepID=L8G535_PSED2|nr:uncharacterized protein VC83_00077 [Pseudogymnoascus destructans]ELR07939.1 hypothetical protein GMDG_02798 [Pseudogymnoascus destructans 20631-21]OAF62964.1 hypothetical protein VC83_00077 [Pseudogymnoascus destructans]WQG15620.1 hypothetical protein VC83_00077 [Pseudogymnoascus destructans]